MIVAILIFLGVTAERPPKEVDEGIAEIFNNNEKIVHHSGDIYCYTNIFKDNKWTNVLLKLPIEFDDSTPRMIVHEFSSMVENIKLNFENNRLFYMSGASTYMYNITQNRIDRFCEGELQFMCEPNSFVTLTDGNLYKCEYYPATYFTKNVTKLADGTFKRYDEDENRVYYSTSAGSNSLVVALDKETLNIILIDNFPTKDMQIEDVLVTDNYVYELIKSNEGPFVKKVSNKSKKENEKIEFTKLPINDAEYIEFIDSKYSKKLEPMKKKEDDSSSDDLYFYVGDLELDPNAYTIGYIVASKEAHKYDEATNKVASYDDNTFNETWLDNYSLFLNGENVELYHNNKYITSVKTSITEDVNLKMNSVNIIGDYLYYEFQISNSTNTDTVFARTMKTGGVSQRINIPE
ncbi:MAG: hypothetical protein IJX99_09965 [Clostridia bacterium]|nr:hypothetical protein [Clostridia bacterium]